MSYDAQPCTAPVGKDRAQRTRDRIRSEIRRDNLLKIFSDPGWVSRDPNQELGWEIARRRSFWEDVSYHLGEAFDDLGAGMEVALRSRFVRFVAPMFILACSALGFLVWVIVQTWSLSPHGG